MHWVMEYTVIMLRSDKHPINISSRRVVASSFLSKAILQLRGDQCKQLLLSNSLQSHNRHKGNQAPLQIHFTHTIFLLCTTHTAVSNPLLSFVLFFAWKHSLPLGDLKCNKPCHWTIITCLVAEACNMLKRWVC